MLYECRNGVRNYSPTAADINISGNVMTDSVVEVYWLRVISFTQCLLTRSKGDLGVDRCKGCFRSIYVLFSVENL